MRPVIFAILISLAAGLSPVQAQLEHAQLDWQPLPNLPDALGVAGPIVGVHNDALLVAGGANFAQPVWESDKKWHAQVYALTPDQADAWQTLTPLPRAIGYAATASTPEGVIVMGGNDGQQTFDTVWSLQWQDGRLKRSDYPPLPEPNVYGAATYLNGVVYLAGGQSNDAGPDKPRFWALDLNTKGTDEFRWRALPAWPGPARVHNLAIAQNNGYDDCVYVISGRRPQGDTFELLKDVWEYNSRTKAWRQRADLPNCVMAGTGIAHGQSQLFVLSGDDGQHFGKADQLKDEHPGFTKRAYLYNTITDAWTDAGETPINQVTTRAVRWQGKIVVPSGEVRPRVRTPQVWSVQPVSKSKSFGWLNYSVLALYLLAMVGVGVYFAARNRSTDDYFRGGGRIPWWAAGCSIYATMLSSLTFTGIPSKAYAQDWVMSVGNFMIPIVAIVAVYVAMPFYRRIDATSAYEYLERRFNRAIRLFGSASFTCFHLFRMAVVMSLTALALAAATPLTPAQSVLMIGVLSLVYCTLGGIEAVIWTDTIQTVVLLGGALLAMFLLMQGIDGGWSGYLSTAAAADKFRIANLHWDMTSTQIAFWCVVVGGFAQNLSSYTADQAVVQRYMTTATPQLAARSIWTNAVLSIPTTFLFFGIGSALFVYYRSNPEKLDPTLTTDQIFPLFIAREMPAGVAGLIVAGIFAAAQSTVSTSMNSAATTIVTDFMRPFRLFPTETAYLNIARLLTLLFGIAGTSLGLLFVNPDIKSLFDTFISVVGLFMGVLGGLFVLGALTRRATALGAMIGAAVGTLVMFCLWRYTTVTFFLYTFSGIVTCTLVGYAASFLAAPAENDAHLDGLTIYTLKQRESP